MSLNTHPYSTRKKSHSNSIAVDPVPLRSKTIQRIEEAKKDLKMGNTYTLEELKVEFGLK